MTDAGPTGAVWKKLAELSAQAINAALDRGDWHQALGHARGLWMQAASQRGDRRGPLRPPPTAITDQDEDAQQARHQFRQIAYLKVYDDPTSVHLAYTELVGEFVDHGFRDEAGFALVDHSLLPMFERFDPITFTDDPEVTPPEGSFAHKVRLWTEAAEQFKRSRTPAAAAGTLKVARAAGRELDKAVDRLVYGRSDDTPVPMIDRLMESVARWFEIALERDTTIRDSQPTGDRTRREVTMDDVVDAFERWAQFRESMGFEPRDIASVLSQTWPRLKTMSGEEARARAEALEQRAEKFWQLAAADNPPLGAAIEQHPAQATRRRARSRGVGGVGR